MLKYLSIANFAVVRASKNEFHQGFNVLTGETGAGKSIIVDALSLLLGARAFGDVIRTGEQIALIEGIFELEAGNEEKVAEILVEVGIEPAGDEYLTIRREVHLNGRSRIFINDRSATAATLRAMQPYLIEIHGQGEQRSLLSARAQLLLLDDFAGCHEVRRKVALKYEEWKMLTDELESLSKNEAERERVLDMLRYQVAEIERMNPQPGEESLLLEERKILTSAERLIELNVNAYQELYESDDSLLTRLASVKRHLQDLEAIDARFSPLLKSLNEATMTLSDVADSLRLNSGLYEYSPARLKEVEDRLSEIDRLKRKHGRGVEDLIEVKEDLNRRLAQLSNWEERQHELLNRLQKIKSEYSVFAKKLTDCRSSAVRELQQRVQHELAQVAMDTGQFQIIIKTAVEDANTTLSEDADAQTLREKSSGLTSDTPGFAYWSPTGADRVEFYLSANVGEQLRPLHRVASGGELSRLMLLLRTICHQTVDNRSKTSEAATLVFDEIDTGIGGRAAEAVGLRLKSLSNTRQVLCVTHQPQIARFADHHYAVAKFVGDGRTMTQIKELERSERVTEIARMLGVSEDVATARKTSEWLLETATNENTPFRQTGNQSRQHSTSKNRIKRR